MNSLLLKLNELGLDVDKLQTQKIKNLRHPSFTKGFNMLNNLTSEDRVLILWDVDIDGMFAGFIAYEGMKKLKPAVKIHNYVNETKTHGFNRILMNYIFENKITQVIAVDCGTNDSLYIEELLISGINVLVIDHHKITVKMVANNFVLINCNEFKEGRNVSGAYLVNEFFKFYFKKMKMDYDNRLDELAIISIVADICDKSDDYNRNLLLNYFEGKIENHPLINIIRDDNYDYSLTAINRISSSLNAILRLKGSRYLMKLLTEKDFVTLDDEIIDIHHYKTVSEAIIKELIAKSKVFEMKEVLICVLPDDYSTEVWEEKVIVRNYVGLIANKLADKYSKLTYVLASKKINYENLEGKYLFCYSARDYKNRNALMLSKYFGLEAEGHPSAFGGVLHKDFHIQFNELNNHLMTHYDIEENLNIIQVSNINTAIEEIKELEMVIGLWNSVTGSEEQILFEFKLNTQITRKARHSETMIANRKLISFNRNLKQGDNVKLLITYGNNASYVLI